MTTALRRFLPEFDAPTRVRIAAPAWKLLDRPPPPSALLEAATEAVANAPEPEPAHDPVGEAVAAALAEAEVRQIAALTTADARAAADLAEARARWAVEEAQAFAEHLGRAVAAAGDGIAEAVALLLDPFLGEAIRRSAVEELRQAVADLVTGGAGGRIAVSGPQDLLDALAIALERSGIAHERLDFAPSDQAEVAITADSSTVRTRLGAWMGALRQRLEGEA